MSTPSGANAPYKIVKRGTKYAVVNNIGETKSTFDSEDDARQYQKALYANVSGAAKRADKVEWTGKARQRIPQQTAAMMAPHGFVWPDGMPNCTMCGEPPNVGNHITPMSGSLVQTKLALMSSNGGSDSGIGRNLAADLRKHKRITPAHAYTLGTGSFATSLPCQACGQPMNDPNHPIGMPAGMGTPVPGSSQTAAAGGTEQGDPLKVETPGPGNGPEEGYGQIVLIRHAFVAIPGQSSIGADYKMCAKCGFDQDDEVHQNGDGDVDKNLVTVKKFAGSTGNQTLGGNPTQNAHDDAKSMAVQMTQKAFVTEGANGHIVISAPASVFSEPGDLPRELAAAWEKASAANQHFMWLHGKFVEADTANRNKAYWSTQDLEMGEPSVVHGPVNWLHSERHIIGAIAGAHLVKQERQKADDVGNHIVAMAALWPYLYPAETRQVAMASEQNKLWYSMECVSREVACLQPGCKHTQSYADYMTKPASRCPHVMAGGARRFVDPSFLGAGIIIPPVRPGWANANATVMKQAASLAERQAASFDGLETSEAELMVAQILTFSGGQR
jgi:hypothetical protein